MRSLADTLAPVPRSPRWERNRFRHSAQFVRDPLACSTPLDRNQRAKLLQLAEGIERSTKLPGRRNGVLGYIGLAVLRALLRFSNGKTGLCYPSILQLQAATKLCRQSISDGLARLEKSGLLRIVRRLIRTKVERVSPVTGLPETYIGTVQTSSLYSFPNLIPLGSTFVSCARELPAANARPFPARRQSWLFEHLIGRVAGSTRQGETNINSFQRTTCGYNAK